MPFHDPIVSVQLTTIPQSSIRNPQSAIRNGKSVRSGCCRIAVDITNVFSIRIDMNNFSSKNNSLFILLVLLLGVASVKADVKPASLFVDHMVLQRNSIVPIWGTADPNEKVTVQIGKASRSAIAASNGKWMVKFSKLESGGPFVITVSGKNALTINDIYVGEVWLCSGQSNMDMTVAREDRYWCGVINEKEEVANANYPLIRVFDVDFTPSQTVKEEVVGKWEIVSPQTIGHLSAAAYFFARDLQKKLKLPIGLITTAYGASTAEAWIREEAMSGDPLLQPLLDAFKIKL